LALTTMAQMASISIAQATRMALATATWLASAAARKLGWYRLLLLQLGWH
jgi:hypothetical protein